MPPQFTKFKGSSNAGSLVNAISEPSGETDGAIALSRSNTGLPRTGTDQALLMIWPSEVSFDGRGNYPGLRQETRRTGTRRHLRTKSLV